MKGGRTGSISSTKLPPHSRQQTSAESTSITVATLEAHTWHQNCGLGGTAGATTVTGVAATEAAPAPLDSAIATLATGEAGVGARALHTDADAAGVVLWLAAVCCYRE